VNGPGVRLATLSGDVDAHMRETVRGLLAALAGAGRAVIDMTGVRYIDSAGVTELLVVHRERAARGGDAIRLVVEKGTNVARLIELAGLARLFVVVETLEEAEGP
jgi:anti-anti-sigma factor